MGERKNIDRLFQEKFKSFEATPSKKVWENIQHELQKENNNTKVIPLWLKISGVAAVVILVLSLSVSFLSDNTDNTIAPTIVDQQKNELDNTNSNKQLNPTPSSNNEVVKNNNFITNSSIVKHDNQNDRSKNKFDDIDKSLQKNGTKGGVILNNQSSTNIIANNSSKYQLNNKTTDRNNANNSTNLSKNNLTLNAITNNDKYSTSKNPNTNKNLQKEKIDDTVFDKEKGTNSFNYANSVVNNNANTLDKKNETEITKEKTDTFNGTIGNHDSTTNITNAIDKEKIDNTLTNSGIAVVENDNNSNENEETDTTKEDTNAIEVAVANQEKLTQENEEDLKKINPSKKWELAPNVAPVYYNTLSDGSPIDDQFKDNPKKGQINMSYGINVSYAINNKLSVRSGVNRLNLGYKTENVSIIPVTAATTSSGVTKSRFDNVQIDPSSNLNISSNEAFSASSIPALLSNAIESSIDQRIGYIEVPLELAYTISSRKMNINLIGGMSSFFLNNNEIYTTSNSNSTYLGKATNVNSVSFSTNIGVGFNYEISKALKINFEPTFKHQLNSFSEDGGFSPYIFGVYSGLSFKF